MTAKLTADNLTLFRGDRCLFKGLSFALNPGELLLLEGSNGSGKTSLLRAIAGLLELESGQGFWNETPLQKERQFCENSLVWMAHKTGFKGDLTLVENLKYEARLRPQSDRDLDDIFSIQEEISLAVVDTLKLKLLQPKRVSLTKRHR